MQNQRSVTDFFSPSTEKLSPIFPRTPLFDVDTKKVRKKMRRSIDDSGDGQIILDVGQKSIGGEYCDQCDMLYSKGSVADMKMHEKHHNRYIDIKEVQISSSMVKSWLSKQCYYNCEHGYVFRVRPDSQSSLKLKLEQVIKDFVNTSVGFSVDLSIWGWDKRRTVWASLSNEGSNYYVTGIVITEALSSAQCLYTGKSVADGKPIIGVNRIWTHPIFRRRGIATEILDIIRKWYFTGILVPRHRVAFSDPSNDGKKFAEKYIRSLGVTEDPILVYTVTK